ncbi:MAG: hypothetical protein HY049_06645 [Acidobacteria bacterium]|nr:hypothetical protein [Acidobacteriota bacterium]
MRTARGAAALIALLLFAVSPAPAGKIVGPNDCLQCHDHQAQAAALQKHPHWRSLDVFEGKKAKEFLGKLNIKDPYSEFCTGCHATVVDGSPDFGVSCESCHGGASEFLKPHQKKGSYEQAISLGMLRTKDLAVRAKNCAGCHVVTDKRILSAGHPNGSAFDIVEGSKKVQHWQESATPDQMKTAWAAAVADRGGIVVAQAMPAAASPAPPPPAAAPSKSAPATTSAPHSATPQPAAAAPVPLPAAPAGGAAKPPESRPAEPAPSEPKQATSPAAAASVSLPPDDVWTADMTALDSVASLQARLILVLNKLIAESGGARVDPGPPEPASATAASAEARLIDLQRRVLALQRKLLAPPGK